jgi:glucose-6-phosphate isomerase
MQDKQVSQISQGLNSSPAVDKLRKKWKQLSSTHLRTLLADDARNAKLNIQSENILFDFSHQKLDAETVELLLELADERELKSKFEAMFRGEKINTTEGRRVLHTALRLGAEDSLILDGVDLVKDVHEVLGRVKVFSDQVRNSQRTGFTGRKLKTFISIGIGGSYLGGDFVYNSLKTHPQYESSSEGLELRFLANVCPIDFRRATKGIDFEETLFIVISKTFTTAETMLNARNCKTWLIESYKERYPYLGDEEINKIISKHFCAVSTNIPETDKFGIEKENVFGFWDWVGGRYSVWSAVGALPLSLVYGYEVFEKFLAGGRAVDQSISQMKNIKENIPLMLGLIGFWNSFICERTTRAILPYSQALCKFPSHIQQLDMESNGKLVSNLTNSQLDYECGPVVFGEAGTNGQHSFYQLIHQGRTIHCEFIAHSKPQFDLKFSSELVSNHEELMSNFFAQPDALAYGKFTEEELKGIPDNLIAHKKFLGDKPSLSILFTCLDAFTTGQLLAIYEHRVATEGFLFEINSFDQWGVELGKVLANGVRKVFHDSETQKNLNGIFNSGTSNLIKYFIKNKEN